MSCALFVPQKLTRRGRTSRFCSKGGGGLLSGNVIYLICHLSISCKLRVLCRAIISGIESCKNTGLLLMLLLVADIQVGIGRLPLPHYGTISPENKGGHHMTFGTRLQQIRKAAGLSQEQLADLINMSRQAISKWETDQAVPDIEKVSLLCDIFKISADELLGNENLSQHESTNGKLEGCVKMNIKKRYFTAGWITALAGTVLLILEYFSLFFLRAMAIRLDVEKGNSLGYYNDPMHYASIQPMPIIFGVTIAVIVIGIVIAVFSAGFMRTKEKKS